LAVKCLEWSLFMSSCPCGNSLDYDQCCGVYHKGENAPTAETLMRARYSAFVKNEIKYVENTHEPGTSDFDPNEAENWAKNSNWLGLEIVKTERGRENDDSGVVEFKANYEDSKNNKITHHEVSNFKKIDGKWYYSSGSIVGLDPIKRSTPKVGRNEPCPCGSGKKFKKCCGA
jgi:SEC-C motif-containing protein